MSKEKAGPGEAGDRRIKATHSLAQLLTVREVATVLGMREPTVYAWVASRRLPVVKLGRSVRISAAVVSALIDDNTVPQREGGGR